MRLGEAGQLLEFLTFEIPRTDAVSVLVCMLLCIFITVVLYVVFLN